MDFVFDKIETTNCAHCGGLVDVVDRPAFAVLPCPHCNIPVRVPGKLGTLLLEEEVGRGAAGIVYKALDSTLHRHVAVKILKPDGGEDNKKIIEATVAEARALAAINHANVVHIHTIGMRHGQPYIVMELLIGSGKLNVMLKEGWIADEKRGLEIGIDVAQGLRAAQAAGLLHRDVKPGNILFNSQAVAKLLDFSVVHAATGDGEKVVIGTPYYIAPEAARGLEVDFRADLYSLGATLFHLMTGKPVFDGESSRDVMRARLKQRAPDIRSIKSGISSATAAVIARMLEIDPKDRHANYDELIADLQAALHSLASGEVEPAVSSELAQLHDALSGAASEAAVPVATPRRTRTAVPVVEKKKISPALIGGGVAVGLAIVVGIIWAVVGGSGKPKDADALATVDPSRMRVTPDDSPANPNGETDKDSAAPADPPPVAPVDPLDTKGKEGDAKTPDPAPMPEPPKVEPPKPAPPKPAPTVLSFDDQYKAWLTEMSVLVKRPATDWKVVRWSELGAPAGTTIAMSGDGTVTYGGTNPPRQIYQLDAKLQAKLTEITAIRIEALPDDALPSRGPGRAPNGNFVLTNLELFVRSAANRNDAGQPYELHQAAADFSQAEFPVAFAVDTDPQTGWAISPRMGVATSAMFMVKSAPSKASDSNMMLRLRLHHQSMHAQHAIGKFRFYIATSADPFLPLNLPQNIQVILTASAGRTADQEKDLQDYFRRTRIEGLPYIPPGGLATATPKPVTPDPKQTPPKTATPVTPPKPVSPPPPALAAYAAAQYNAKDAKLYDADEKSLIVIPRFAAWHVWAKAESPPTDWAAANFQASGWSLEDAAFGYGGYDNLKARLDDMKGSHPVVYARAPFTIADPTQIQDLQLQGRFDDAIIVYLNGQQVYRSPTLTGAGSSAKVSQPAPRAVLTTYELKDFKKHLKAGANVIAIECHNASKDDLDFILDPALVAVPTPAPRKAVANNKKDNWGVSDGKLYMEDGLLVEATAKPPKLENGSTKTNFEDRGYNVRVFVKLKSTAAGQVKVEARCKPKNAKSSITDSDTQAIVPSARMGMLSFRVKVTGKLESLAIHLPKGDTTIESIRVISERDNKELEAWDFTK